MYCCKKSKISLAFKPGNHAGTSAYPNFTAYFKTRILLLFYCCVFVESISANRHSAYTLLQSDTSIMLAWSLNTRVSKSLSTVIPEPVCDRTAYTPVSALTLRVIRSPLPHHTQLHFHVVFFPVYVCFPVLSAAHHKALEQLYGCEDRLSPGQQPPSAVKSSQRVVTLAQHISVSATKMPCKVVLWLKSISFDKFYILLR